MPMGPPPGGHLSRVGKYVLERQLGAGAMGVVWLSRHPDLDIPVAVKTLNAGLMSANPQFVDRFLREARSAALINHPNVVRVYDAGSDGGVYYLVMEYVEGGTAADLVTRYGGELPPEQAHQIVLGTAMALEAAAEYRIVHRDIKPGNIMIDARGTPKLADLGLAKLTGQEGTDVSMLTMTGATFGSPGYIAPEQAKDSRGVDARADIYALGASFYQLLTGHLPYEAESAYEAIQMHLNAPLPDPRDLRRGLPPCYGRMIRRMMAKQPEDRPQTAADLVRELRAMPVGPGTNPAASDQKTVLLSLVLLLLLAVVGLGSWLLFTRTPPPARVIRPPAARASQSALPSSIPGQADGVLAAPSRIEPGSPDGGPGIGPPVQPIQEFLATHTVGILPSPRQDLADFLEQNGLVCRQLTWEEAASGEVLDATAMPIVIHAAGGDHRPTVAAPFDVDRGLERYLRAGGVLAVVGVGRDDFPATDGETGLGPATVTRLGIPVDIGTRGKPVTGPCALRFRGPITMDLGASSVASMERGALAGVTQATGGDTLETLAYLCDANDEVIGNAYSILHHRSTEPANGRVVYMWGGFPDSVTPRRAYAHLFLGSIKTTGRSMARRHQPF